MIYTIKTGSAHTHVRGRLLTIETTEGEYSSLADAMARVAAVFETQETVGFHDLEILRLSQTPDPGRYVELTTFEVYDDLRVPVRGIYGPFGDFAELADFVASNCPTPADVAESGPRAFHHISIG